MLDTVRPDVVAAFGSIYQHLQVVEACAPRGIHVLVEKPLAVNMEHARRMGQLAKQHAIHLLTNYETTWYASNHSLYHMIHAENRIGPIRKIVVCDGHRGPQEIGATPEFLEWLTDPVQNGGGAVIDFGCYGANLITWLMGEQLPNKITCSIQKMKPDIYPHVDDDATIILDYERSQGIIQGSWNWPIGRKDIEVYGQTGFIHAPDRAIIRYQMISEASEVTQRLEPQPAPFDDPFAWLAAVVRGSVTVGKDDLSGLTNNLAVVQILDAARESARTGRSIHLRP
jgi:predicted dehydrogenase